MKKLILITVACLLLTTSLSANLSTEFLKKIAKMTKGKVDDIVTHIPSKSSLSKVLNKNIHAPKLKPLITKNPNKILLINKADKITSKGDFEKRFFANQNFDNQLAVIVQSSKYGDEYFAIAQKISHVSPDVVKNSPKLLKYISPHKLNKKTLQTKFVNTLMHTGEAGWKRLKEIGNWAVKHPKISAVSGVYAWYALNPISFEEALKGSGQTLGEFLVTTLTTATSGIGSGIANKGQEIIDNTINDFKDDAVSKLNNSTPYLLNLSLGILFFIGTFIIWRKRKIIHNFITKADEAEKDTVKHNRKKEKDEF